MGLGELSEAGGGGGREILRAEVERDTGEKGAVGGVWAATRRGQGDWEAAAMSAAHCAEMAAAGVAGSWSKTRKPVRMAMRRVAARAASILSSPEVDATEPPSEEAETRISYLMP